MFLPSQKKNFVLLLAAVCLAFFSVCHNAAAGSEPNALRVGVLFNSPPLSFPVTKVEQLERHGLAIELSSQLNTALGYGTIFHTGTRGTLNRMLMQNEVDYIIVPKEGIAPLDGKGIVDTGIALNRRMLVTEKNQNIAGLQDLSGRSVVLLQSDSYIGTASKSGARVTLVETYQEALAALAQNRVDAFIAPSGESALHLAVRDIKAPVMPAGASLGRNPLLIVFAEENTPLLQNVINELFHMEQRGALETLRKNWLSKDFYTEPGFWVRHRGTFYTILAVLGLLVLLGIGWTVLLRRQVRMVTRRLRLSEQNYRELFHRSPYLALVMDAEGHVYLSNRSAQAIQTVPDARAPGLVVPKFQNADNAARFQQLLREAAAGASAQCELALPIRENQPKIFEMTAFAMPKYDGTGTKICCLAYDITDRLRMEKELVEADRLAVIGKLAAGVAHEINNPLGIILANAEMLQGMIDAPQCLPFLKAIQRNVERAGNITRRLLNLAVPEQSRPQVLNLSDMVLECLDFLRPQLKKVNVDIAGLEPGLPICGDKIQLEQIIINLLLNALTSMGGEGSIRICGKTQGRDNDTVRLVLQDSGKGIARENLGKIFEMFYTFSNDGGMGLGLFICRHIAERHEGVLYAESEPGHGASFFLELPAGQGGGGA